MVPQRHRDLPPFGQESSGGGTTPAAVVLPAFILLGEGVLVPLSWCSLGPLHLTSLGLSVSTGERRAVTPLAKYLLLPCGSRAFWSQKARAAPSDVMCFVPASLLGSRCWSQAIPRTMWRRNFPMAWMRAVAQMRKRTVSARSQGGCAPCLSRVGSAGAVWERGVSSTAGRLRPDSRSCGHFRMTWRLR